MIRLDKVLSHLGYGSRKEVKEIIRKGLVSVNGNIIKNDDFKIDEKQDEIILLNEKINYEKFVYLIMNKPAGVVSATYDSNEKTVLDLIDGYEKRGLFPIGRLDKDTTGLLILSNDGKLAHQLLSPVSHVSKVYEVNFTGIYQEKFVEQFRNGLILEDGMKCLPAELRLIKEGFATIKIMEGKFHQVKRMFECVGLKVTALKRVSFGGLILPEGICLGDFRPLELSELELLKLKDVPKN
ncbi:MAG: rRNA pseudouridine synthase [Anaeroplasmataceae bacterium]|nr:rRNA pseudouridine synthase [Anaeroplasmataceae bacterium]MDE5867631.1 rRNA pseudouridine synthase [Anaeroplasmataceae bacterium]